MYFDEDGDVAHEFYEEVPPLRRGVKATMRRILTNLTPQVSNIVFICKKWIYLSFSSFTNMLFVVLRIVAFINQNFRYVLILIEQLTYKTLCCLAESMCIHLLFCKKAFALCSLGFIALTFMILYDMQVSSIHRCEYIVFDYK